MSTKYVEEGHTLDYANAGSAIASGDPVKVAGVGSAMLGVAHDDIAATTGTGVVRVAGVHTLPKTSGAVIKRGERVNWDVSAGSVDDDQATPGAGDFWCGTAWEDAGNGVTVVNVKLNGYSTTVT